MKWSGWIGLLLDVLAIPVMLVALTLLMIMARGSNPAVVVYAIAGFFGVCKARRDFHESERD